MSSKVVAILSTSTGGRTRAQEGGREVLAREVAGISNEPANTPQSLRVNPPKSRNSFPFAGPFAVRVLAGLPEPGL